MTYCLKVLLRYRDLFVRGGGRGGRVADDVRRGGREAALWATRRCRWKMVGGGEGVIGERRVPHLPRTYLDRGWRELGQPTWSVLQV